MKLLSSTPLSDTSDLQCAFASSNKYVAVSIDNHSVHVLDLHGTIIRSFVELGCRCWGIAISQETILIGGLDGTIRVHEISSGELVRTFSKHDNIDRLDIPEQMPYLLLSSCDEGIIKAWNLDSGECVQTFIGQQKEPIWNMQIVDGVLYSVGKTLCIWSLSTGECIHALQDFGAYIFSMVIVDETMVVTGSGDGKIRIWDSKNGLNLATVDAHHRVVNGLHLYDGRIVSTGTDGYARIWSFNPLRQDQNMKIYDHAVTTRDLHAGILVTGGKNGGLPENVCGIDASVRIWDFNAKPATGFPALQVIGRPSLAVWKVRFVSDRLVVSHYYRGKPTVDIWDTGA